MNSNCVICFKNKKIFCIYPCGHLCLCFSCSSKYPRDFIKCPLCRTIIQDIIKIPGIQTDEIISHDYKVDDEVLSIWPPIRNGEKFNSQGNFYKGKITKLNYDGSYDIKYPDKEYKNIRSFNIKQKLSLIENEQKLLIPPAPSPIENSFQSLDEFGIMNPPVLISAIPEEDSSYNWIQCYPVLGSHW